MKKLHTDKKQARRGHIKASSLLSYGGKLFAVGHTYVKPKSHPKPSFTRILRNKKGYGDYLAKKYLNN